MSEINVIYQFNEKYVPYAGVSITSLLDNNRDAESINVYVLGEELENDSKTMLEKCVSKYDRSLFFPDTSKLICRFKDMGMIPYRGAYSVYLRLFFDQIVNLPGKKALYLDADTIIDRDILPLINYDLGGKSVGMVMESIRDDYKTMIGMKPDADYYNSGVILFDVDKWIENKYCMRIVEHIQKVRSSYIGDQDFLNIVCEEDVCTLPLSYNFQPLHGRYTGKEYFGAYGLIPGHGSYYKAEDIDSTRGRAAIYHCYRWLGEFPWNKGNKHPFCDVFDKYLLLSPWKGYTKEKAGMGLVLRVEKILYRILPKRVFIKVFKQAHEMMLKRAENDARSHKVNEKA